MRILRVRRGFSTNCSGANAPDRQLPAFTIYNARQPDLLAHFPKKIEKHFLISIVPQ